MKFEDCRDTIAALVPFYDEGGGNATRIYTVSGEVIEDSRTLRWVIKKIARVFAADLEALRHNYGSYLSLSQGVPLPFSDKLVMVPLKLRRVISENDGAGGYINMCAVEKVEDYIDDEIYKSRIHLTGDRVIPCIFARKTVERRLRSGEHARERYLYNNQRGCYASGSLVKENGGIEEIPAELLMAMGKLFLKSLNTIK